jgi:hypothetical protein
MGGTAATATGLSAGTYTVTVTDANGCEATQSFTITEPAAILINTQPEDETVAAGGNASFTVNASNADSYQWQVSTNGTTWNDVADGGTNPVYSGATTSELSLTNVPSSFNDYLYRVVLTNNGTCTVESETALLTVSNSLLAVDDDFSATVINQGTGGVAGDVTGNDLMNANPVNDVDITITITDDGGMTGVTIDTDGNLTVPATATQGNYTIVYSICEIGNATNCSQAEVTVVVSPPLSREDFYKGAVTVYPNQPKQLKRQAQ